MCPLLDKGLFYVDKDVSSFHPILGIRAKLILQEPLAHVLEGFSMGYWRTTNFPPTDG
jgi:hypothetical protein